MPIVTGTVTAWDHSTRCGKVTPDAGGDKINIGTSTIVSEYIRHVCVNDKVEYELNYGKVRNVRIVQVTP